MLYVNHTSIKKRKVTYGGRSWGKQAGKLKLKGFREIEKKLPSTLRTTMSQEKHGSKNKHTARVIPLFEGAKKSKSQKQKAEWQLPQALQEEEEINV